VSQEAKLKELRERLGEILDLKRASALLGWDQQTMMPPAGNDARSDQLATIDRMSHELFVSDEVGKLLDDLAQHEQELDPESIDAALIRTTRRDYEKARRVPPELQAEITKAEVLGVMAWAEARRNSDFEAFLPYLEKNVDLKQRYIECFKDTGKSDYDILLDDYQEGARSEEITAIFERVKEVVIPLIQEVKAAEPVQTDFAHGHFPVEKQELVGREILERLGYSSEAWRLDPTVHPFATSISVDDIRLTTRYSETDAESIFHTSHEFGHGIYENGIDRELERTPLVELNSMVCTSRRAASGRTSSAVRGPSGASSSRGCRRSSPSSSAGRPTRCTGATSTASSRTSSASRPTRSRTGCTSSCGTRSSRRSSPGGWS